MIFRRSATRTAPIILLGSLLCVCAGQSFLFAAEVTARLVITPPEVAAPPAVIWLQPVKVQTALTVAPGSFTLLQKDRMFRPHLLVVPVGSSVAFPNADPFFHNVFSLFDGKRFDLGLYEAGSTRTVVFSREGVSYIFCNIHSEMSAVVIALSTPLYAIADAHGEFHLKDAPDGDYDMHLWVEGQHQNALELQTRRVHVAGDLVNLGELHAEVSGGQQHLNKFGRSYEPETKPIY